MFIVEKKLQNCTAVLLGSCGGEAISDKDTFLLNKLEIISSKSV